MRGRVGIQGAGSFLLILNASVFHLLTKQSQYINLSTVPVCVSVRVFFLLFVTVSAFAGFGSFLFAPFDGFSPSYLSVVLEHNPVHHQAVAAVGADIHRVLGEAVRGKYHASCVLSAQRQSSNATSRTAAAILTRPRTAQHSTAQHITAKSTTVVDQSRPE